jgi:uncharacterized protein
MPRDQAEMGEARSSCSVAMTTRHHLAIIALFWLLSPAAAQAAAIDCRASRLTAVEIAICADANLARLDDQLSRRLSRASRQLAFGPYVGLRIWQSDWRQQRAECSADRACLAGVYSEASRFLDRLQRCLGTSLRGRRCLPVSVDAERSVMRRP